MIHPGETLCATLEVDGERVDPLTVTSSDDPENTLIVRSWNERGTEDTYLSLHNPLDVFLRYEATVFEPGTSEGQYSSSCPVLSRRLGIEHWPYLVREFQLGRFAAEPESEEIVCR